MRYILSVYIIHISVMSLHNSKVKLQTMHPFQVHVLIFPVTLKAILRHVSVCRATFLSPHFFLSPDTLDDMLLY